MVSFKELSRWLAEVFKPCYVPEEKESEQEENSEQNEGAAEAECEEVPPSASSQKHSYFPDIPSKEDLLGFDAYAMTLSDLIADPQTQTPLTVGIFGSWGSGKSTLMHMIRNELKEREEKSKEDFVIIPFNAWKYGREDALHRAIILRVLDSLRVDETNSHNSKDKPNALLTNKLEKLEQRLYKDVEWEEKGRLTIDWPKLVKSGAGGAAKLSYSFLPGLSGLTDAVKAAQGAVGKGEPANDVADLFGSFQRDAVKHHQVQLRHIEQFQEQFDNLVSKHFPNKRIVIFVDDLDRCLPEKTIEILEAIKLFMDVKRCVFVLGGFCTTPQKGIVHTNTVKTHSERECSSC